MKDHSSDIVKSSEVVGVSVINTAKENLGKIEEIVLDRLTGQTRYVVLSFGGMLGVGDKYFSIPWKSISYSPEDKAFVLKVDKNKIKDAPGFDKNNWPIMSSEFWGQQFERYYL